MISILVKMHIYRRAKQLHINIPRNYEEIIKKYKKAVNANEHNIAFSWFYGIGDKTLHASAMVPKVVVMNAEWAARIVLFDNESAMNAFKITVGHELTHKDKEISRLKYLGADRKFIAQVNEVHADFDAAQKMANSSRDALLRAIHYKKALKQNDNGDFAHPSWARRGFYVENFDFGEGLIRQIAKDVNCDNKELIDRVIEFYDEIILE